MSLGIMIGSYHKILSGSSSCGARSEALRLSLGLLADPSVVRAYYQPIETAKLARFGKGE
jgi:hypothetical protein